MEQLQSLDNGILIVIGSLFITILLSWLSLFLAPKINLMDDPNSADHKNHLYPTPITGGLVLFDTILILMNNF
jgi:UDP-N-acetylmuramyl pentapeptide phosphotransferase/UDP-N-acetylglucosamine-1-phosphate transferase